MPPRPPAIPATSTSAAVLAVLLTLCSSPMALGVDEHGVARDEEAALEFFERQVRPLLAARCFECHGEESEEGGLRLDSRNAWQVGGDRGAAIVPGDPKASLLLRAVQYEDPDLKMPPDGRMSDAEIESLRKWIADGAIDPREGETAKLAKPAIDWELARQHWSYRPIHDSGLPDAPNSGELSADPIDRFIAHRRIQAGLTSAPPAPTAVLVRRLFVDLTGLPPTPADLERWKLADDPDVRTQLVDELLASHAFGERFGRHWLDVVRYADSVTLRGLVFPNAWRYRDYVIESFAADRPFDEFIREQVAGDLMTDGTIADRQRTMIASTFLTLGNTNLENQDKPQLDLDIVDEQLDVIGKAFLAQTIGCARCHDHKFDPIPTRDYYALAGILSNVESVDHSNVSRWIDSPLPLSDAEQQPFAAHEAQVAELQGRIAKLDATLKEMESPLAVMVLQADQLPGIVVDSDQAQRVGEWQPSTHTGRYINTGYLHDINTGKGQKSLTFTPRTPADGEYEVCFSYSWAAGRATNVPITILHADGETSITVDESVEPAIGRRFVSLGRYRFEAGNQGYVLVGTAGTNGHVTADAVVFVHDPEELAPPNESSAAATELRETQKRLTKQLKELQSAQAARPMAMTVRERKTIADLAIAIRGNVHTRGEVVPRGYLTIAAPDVAATIAADKSGRQELADWLTHSSNPLTARVIVNRVWMWVMGDGLVRTPNNFGTRGELPTHPELLDHLAAGFVADGWSVKKLVRRIVLSETYRRSSVPTVDALESDPRNVFWSHANRRRMEAEVIRDSMLQASGELTSESMLATPAIASDYGYQHDRLCRSVYLPVFRNALPSVFEAFDFPDTGMPSGKRNASTVAPQALFLMNDAFVTERARVTASRLIELEASDEEERIETAFLLVLGRAPSGQEMALARDALDQPAADPATRLTNWQILVQGLFASPDFRYLK